MSVQFKNSGIVTGEMVFEYRDQLMFYAETEHEWTTKDREGDYLVPYLFEKRADGHRSPPSGIRSAVPLGGLGSGTIELRGDGSLRDWNIFNNSPAGGGPKVQLPDAFFGIRTETAGGATTARTLRTHPPGGLPPVAQIEYAGAFPVSRLRIADGDLPVRIELYAYSEFHIRDAAASATPAILFRFQLDNPADEPVAASLLFHLPNAIRGRFGDEGGLSLSKNGEEPASGSLAMHAHGADRWTACAGETMDGIWRTFAASGQFEPGSVDAGVGVGAGVSAGVARDSRYGAISAHIGLLPGEQRTVTFVLAWYFPFRPHHEEVLGNYYTRLYRSAEDVAGSVLSRLDRIWSGIVAWNRLCFDNDLPDWLQDTLVNSAATMAKTGMWFADGRWRQWESFSCPDVDAIHIHFYRTLPYDLFFPELKQNLFRAYARGQTEDGYIQEMLGFNDDLRKDNLDTPCGRDIGDSCTTFILGVYMNYVWTGDGEFFRGMWPHARRAAEWQMRRSEAHGLPDRLLSTYDLSRFDTRDVIAYNAFLHMAALMAAASMAGMMGERTWAEACERHLRRAREAAEARLWTGEFYRCWWTEGEASVDAMHVDALYGQLWASILGLGWTTDPERMRRHLGMEKQLNDTPYGLQVLTGANTEPAHPLLPSNDLTAWEAGSINWSTLMLYVGGDVRQSLEMAEKVINKWRLVLCDQWDYKDLTAIWDGHPWCNSHYTRQLIVWALPLALTGQQYSAVERRLSFDLKPGAPRKLPFFVPGANGTIETPDDGAIAVLTVLSGELSVDELVVNRHAAVRGVKLAANESLRIAL